MVKAFVTFEDLSPEEQDGVTELKRRMVGHLNQKLFDDLFMFVRFLRARDLNVNAAELMLKNHIEWRKKLQVDTLLTDYKPKEVLKKYFAFSTLGVDKEGSPILYFDVGNLDTRGLLKTCRHKDVTKLVAQELERDMQIMKSESLKRGYHVDKVVMILNFEGLSFSVATHKETLEIIGSLIMMYEANYPERLKTAFFINSSIYFTMAFAVVKHILSERTYRKINFFGRDGWREELLKTIDPEVLPAFLGGDKTDPDGNPLCLTSVTHGTPVDEKYYINKKESALAGIPGVEKLTVTRMSKNQVQLIVKEMGSHIEWEFETKSRDIGFSLLYKKNEYGRMKVLIPKQRIDTNVSTETGIFKCDELGIYIIEFDNTYSWMHQKEVYYKAAVVANSVDN